MSEFAVYRTLGNGRCLVLDGTRIAGGKPDYRGNNFVTSWVTKKTYGPIDEIKDENAKLRELVNILVFCANEDKTGCDGCLINGDDMRVTVPEWMFCDSLIKRLRELGIEVD